MRCGLHVRQARVDVRCAVKSLGLAKIVLWREALQARGQQVQP
jgi:hypothetical protein